MGYVEELRSIIGHRPIILVGANVIVTDDQGRVLLQKRREPKGIWGLPGGLMELGESVEETARREVQEETGLIVGELTLIGVFSGSDYYIKVSNGDEFYVVAIAYIAMDVTGEAIVNDEESLEVAYAHLDQLPDKMAKTHREMLDQYKEFETQSMSRSSKEKEIK